MTIIKEKLRYITNEAYLKDPIICFMYLSNQILIYEIWHIDDQVFKKNLSLETLLNKKSLTDTDPSL